MIYRTEKSITDNEGRKIKIVSEDAEYLEDIFDHIKNYNTTSYHNFVKAIASHHPNYLIKGEWFYKTNTYEEALNQYLHGDAETAREVREKFNNLKVEETAPEIIKRDEYFYDTEGLFFDVGEVLTGTPEHWLNVIETEGHQNRRIITIFINITTAWNVSKETYLLKGASVIKLTELLELNGYGVNIIALESTRNKTDDYFEMSVKLKDSTQALDFERLSYVMANVDFYRRHIFNYMTCRDQKEIEKFMFDQNMGYCTQHSKSKNLKPDEIYLNASVLSQPSAEKWIIDQLQKFNVLKEG